MNEDVRFVFTSEHALKRSIWKKYPTADPAILEATFEDMKKYVGWRQNKEGDWISPEGKVNVK